MEFKNENAPISWLPQPSRMRSPGKMSEMPASAFNARNGTMLPPEQGTKRKTLADRAGEPPRPAPPPPGSRPAHTSFQPTSLSSIAREASSSSSSISSRSMSSASTRTASNGSFSRSIGPGVRPSYAQSRRPRSALGGSRIQKPTISQPRPATSLDAHQEEENGEILVEGRRCMTPISSCPPYHQDGTHGNPIPRVRQRMPGIKNRMSTASSDPFALISLRDISISTRLGELSLEEKPELSPSKSECDASSPSRIPKRTTHASILPRTPSVPKAPPWPPLSEPQFLSKSSNVKSAWDTESRLKEVEYACSQFKEQFDSATSQVSGLQETISMYKARANELEETRAQLLAKNNSLELDLDSVKNRLTTSTEESDNLKRHYKNEIDDLHREHKRRMEDAQHSAESQTRRIVRDQAEKFDDIRRKLDGDLQDEKRRHEGELLDLKKEGFSCQEQADKALEKQRAAHRSVELDLETSKLENTRQQEVVAKMQTRMNELSSVNANLETSVQRLESHIKFLESDNKSQSQAFADLEARMQNAIKVAAEANEKLIKEETLRRKLHNQVQELKGNIRVFCRSRPPLEHDTSESARIMYPDVETDSKEIEVMGPEEKSSLGNITTRKNAFEFDRVFGPSAQNEDIFGEISQLVQSALDGYNVCIFCYGQTGSGKTFTMSAQDGMIPRAVHQIYDTARSLEEKGWKYHMEGSFIEVYNENLNDLLGKAEEFDNRKHEIKHDLQKGKTTITGISTVELDGPNRVNSILARAMSNRSVAATQANERSSRGHSVFILRLTGENNITGEKSEGTLNLVDLAGSERLSHSGATGERLKETQNINKSLSCLGDVIGALGQGKEGAHVPYRNSKLTYLLQNSLGGNSKTLMFVMISPLQVHLSETLTSLKFATKVHNTHIGTARKQSKA